MRHRDQAAYRPEVKAMPPSSWGYTVVQPNDDAITAERCEISCVLQREPPVKPGRSGVTELCRTPFEPSAGWRSAGTLKLVIPIPPRADAACPNNRGAF